MVALLRKYYVMAFVVIIRSIIAPQTISLLVTPVDEQDVIQDYGLLHSSKYESMVNMQRTCSFTERVF
jgi:hypothetical protein